MIIRILIVIVVIGLLFGSVNTISAGEPPPPNAVVNASVIPGPAYAVVAGEIFTYTITVFNNGPPSTGSGFISDFLLGPGFEYLDANGPLGPCVITPELFDITCFFASIPSGGSEDFTVTVKVGDAALSGEIVSSGINVSCSNCDVYNESFFGPQIVRLDFLMLGTDGFILSAEDIETIGGTVFVNNDNDDGDSFFDFEDNDGVSNEDDLLFLRAVYDAHPLANLPAMLELIQGSELVNIWEFSNKTSLIDFSSPMVLGPGDEIKKFYIEAIAPSVTPRDIVFNFTIVRNPIPSVPADTPVQTKATVTAITINEIKLLGNGNSATGGNVLDVNNPPGGSALGLRVFPDARPTSCPGPYGPSLDKVTVQVEMNVNVPQDIDIILRSFDIDDPVTATASTDPNDDALGGTSGDYKTADGTTLYSDDIFNGLTGACGGNRLVGIAPQPYNTLEDNRGDVNLKKSGELAERYTDANGNGIFDVGEIFEDANGTMGWNKESGQTLEITITKGTNTTSVDLQVTQQPGDNFKVVGSHSFSFISNLRNLDGVDGINIVDPFSLKTIPKNLNSTELTVWRFLHLERDQMSAPAGIVFPGAGGVGTNADDVGPGQPGSASIFVPGTNVVKKPNFSLISSSLAPHYILVTDDLEVAGMDTRNFTPFRINFNRGIPFAAFLLGSPSNAALIGAAGLIRDCSSANNFWVVHLIGAYELSTNRDNDAPGLVPPIAKERGTLGRAVNSAVEDPTGLQTSAWIFHETIRDEHAASGAAVTGIAAEARATAHETGHVLSLCHNGNLMSGNFAAANPNWPLSTLTFSNSQQSAQRSLNHP